MLAGYGAKCGADDKGEETGDAQGTCGDLPAVQKDGLCGGLVLQSGDPVLVFEGWIWSAGEGPECVC